MRKTKRLFAVLLTLAMVLGMSITAFADVTSTKITVKNVNAGNHVTYEQIIEPDPTQPTGWAFTTEPAAGSFKNTIKGSIDKSDQEIIAGLIRFKDEAKWESLTLPETLKENAAVIDADLFKNACNAAALNETAEDKGNGEYEVPAVKAGVYLIHAENVKKTDENGIVTGYIKYSPMAAYVSFDYNGGLVPAAIDAEVDAKKEDSTVQLTKEDSETDKVTAVGDIVQYTIKTTVPYIPETVEETTDIFKIVDMIGGAQYVKADNAEVGPAPAAPTTEGMLAKNADDTVAVTVKIGEEERLVESVKTAKLIAVPDDKTGYDYAFELALDEIAAERGNAGETLEITYKAYVTSTVVNNHAQTKVKTEDILEDGPGADDHIYTGTLKMTKYNGDAEEGAAETLANAKFVLYYQKSRTENGEQVLDNTKYYAVTKPVAGGTGIDYQVTGWTTENPVDRKDDAYLLITKKSTDAQINGTFTVKGLEDDEDRVYFFEEVEAPEGYSLNTEDAGITWDLGRGHAESAASRLGEAAMSDTKLSALPSTGGIGTTIFTIAGCLIMIAAAGLFFVSRRKSEK